MYNTENHTQSLVISYEEKEIWERIDICRAESLCGTLKTNATLYINQACCVLSHFSQVRLCNPVGYRPPGSSVHGILQARILERVSMPFSR